MTKQEAIEAMKSGAKVTHRYFSSDEWATQVGTQIQFEDGARVHESIFWADRSGVSWNKDWSIWNETINPD